MYEYCLSDILKLIVSACPDCWECNSVHGICYYVIPERHSWSEANDMCKYLDPEGEATLTSIYSPLENDFFQSIADDDLWIGGTDEYSPGLWK